VLGLPVNEVLDIGGWDIKKALKLFLKSNGPLYEWLQSPIIYRQDEGFISEVRELMPAYFCLRAGANHYLSMAHNTFRDDLQAEQVKLKRYFYALRPALACLWIIEKQSVPPMEFDPLRVLIKDELVQKYIDDLLVKKSVAYEKAYIAPVEQLNEWLKVTLEYCRKQVPMLSSNKQGVDELNTLFRKYIS
jgi:predicted nucleotidyltransferase